MTAFRWKVVGALVALSLSSSANPAFAQPRNDKRDKKNEIPKEYLPPAGMCRVWVDGVPAAQQPAPTDCATAVRKKPANGRVLYGDKVDKGGEPFDKLPIRSLKTGKGPPLIPPLATADRGAREAWEARKISDDLLFGDRPADVSPASSFPATSVLPQGPTGSLGGFVTPSGVVIPGAVNDPRFFNTAPGVRPPGFGSTICLDRDGDGWCDDLRFGPPVCLDRDTDGRCDDLPEFASQAFPQVLPPMRAVLDVVQGRPSVEVMQWIGTNEFSVRVPGQGRGGVPWRAIFLDQRGELLQVWTDVNRDGRADRVEIFRNGERVKLIQR